MLTELFVILDTTGLRRSQVAAKQLAHNAISGFDDQSTLKEIAKMIDDEALKTKVSSLETNLDNTQMALCDVYEQLIAVTSAADKEA